MVTTASAPLTRRCLIAGTAAATGLLLGSCAGPGLPILAATDPDDELRRAVAGSERLLLDAYAVLLASAPQHADRLRRIADQHQEHLRIVSAGLDLPTPVGTPTGAPPSLRVLRRLEAGAARQRIDACVAAEDAGLAEVLARIGAAESGHVAFLQGLSS